jgi:pSer/pThr/pTyr-binding forkhead associated (FHA) protein
LKVLEGQLVNNIFIIGAVGAALGRHSASNDIVISESFVSRRHCDVKYNETTNQFLISDVGSTTGTFIMIRQSPILKVGTMF